MYVVETNLMQRSFSDMLPSERAAGLALRYSDMFSQGKRNDIMRELQTLNGEAPDQTCGTEFHKSLSRDCLGDKYNLTGRSIANYLRLNKLINSLKERLDNNTFTIKSGVNLSYLPETEQFRIANALSSIQGKLSDGKAAEIRKKYEAQELNESTLKLIFQGAQKTRAIAVKLPPQTYASISPLKRRRARLKKRLNSRWRCIFQDRKERRNQKYD
jgi:ParB family chromosome partitioning protein